MIADSKTSNGSTDIVAGKAGEISTDYSWRMGHPAAELLRLNH